MKDFEQQKEEYLLNGKQSFQIRTTKGEILLNNSWNIIQESNNTIKLFNREGKAFTGKIITKKQNQYTVLLNNNTYTFNINNTRSINRKAIIQQKKKAPSAEIIKTPMPGKICEILVRPGDMVKKGDTLLILEAMKMQNQIVSPGDFMVKSILVKPGNTVSNNQTLIELKE